MNKIMPKRDDALVAGFLVLAGFTTACQLRGYPTDVDGDGDIDVLGAAYFAVSIPFSAQR